MARRRASMREGPLAELFRATEAAQRQTEKEGEPGAEGAARPNRRARRDRRVGGVPIEPEAEPPARPGAVRSAAAKPTVGVGSPAPRPAREARAARAAGPPVRRPADRRPCSPSAA